MRAIDRQTPATDRPLKPLALAAAVATSLLALATAVRADAVVDWSGKSADILVAHRLGPPPANRALAIVQVSVFEAVNAITRRYPQPSRVALDAPAGASVDAAIAAASATALSRLAPSQQAAIDTAYQAALAALPEGTARANGIAVGEQAALAVLALRADDGAAAPDTYRPLTTAGAYVPTTLPAAPQWPQRKPWLMTRADQFRPGPPPELKSAQWARDYNEIKALGSRNSTTRTPEQTETARFWEAVVPQVYLPVVHSVARQTGRDVAQNARLLSAVYQAVDDALIAVWDAKYHYALWRPLTAIRNGDIDGNDATERDAAWLPLIDAPMHPEYPCAHCIVSAAIGAVLQAEVGDGAMPRLSSTSPLLPGVTHSWTSVAEFTREVASARVYAGVHYRNSTEVGSAMGRNIGELSAARNLR
jgi:PAP2 superfamily